VTPGGQPFTLRRRILFWFVEKDARGSQASPPMEHSLFVAAANIANDLKVNTEAVLPELTQLRNEGLIVVESGQGDFRGAWVTKIAQRGRDELYARNDMAQLVSALQGLVAAINTSGTPEAKAAITDLDAAIEGAAATQSSLEKVGEVLNNASSSIRTAAAIKPAWDTAASVLRMFGIHLPDWPT
jgi:predicted ArsR family transcriptional regulator